MAMAWQWHGNGMAWHVRDNNDNNGRRITATTATKRKRATTQERLHSFRGWKGSDVSPLSETCVIGWFGGWFGFSFVGWFVPLGVGWLGNVALRGVEARGVEAPCVSFRFVTPSRPALCQSRMQCFRLLGDRICYAGIDGICACQGPFGEQHEAKQHEAKRSELPSRTNYRARYRVERDTESRYRANDDPLQAKGSKH
jgi:hypothetical protein